MPHTHTVMMCDECELVDESFHPDISAEELKADPEAVLMAVKVYFQDQGWYTSLGYDVCPNCREKKGI